MVDWGPACAAPSCSSEPTIGFRSAGLGGYGNHSHGGFGFTGFCGLGNGGGALAESASYLGIMDGSRSSSSNPIPPSEVVIQRPPCVVIFPSPILSATHEPVAVGSYAPGAIGGNGLAGGLGHRGFGYGFGHMNLRGPRDGYLGHYNQHHGSICN